MGPTVLPALPFPLRWLSPPAESGVADETLTIVAGPRCDWFIDPDGVSEPVLNAPALVGEPEGDFILSARVTVDFAATFDAGVLVLFGNDRTWAKLCFEYSPAGEPMVVSVVTRGVSDDCNAFAVEGNQVWLRVARLGAAFAFHASSDGRIWRLVRYFGLDHVGALAAGFEAQSPMGDGCRVNFDEIRFEPARLADLRNGS
jgi:regulation of enolase protein 1 (concanavalin A-like superfamily)